MDSKSIKNKLGKIIDFENIIPAAILTVIIIGTELKTHPLLVSIIGLLYAIYRLKKMKTI